MIARLINGFAVAVALCATLAGCGGGGGDDGTSSTGGSASTSIGVAGGSVVGPAGAQVVIPAGALATITTIGVAQSSAGIPALPTSVTPFGPIFAFTPHGTSFATAVTITVPFDPALVQAGTTPVLYKTNATMTGWAEVAGAVVSGNTMSGEVTGFSNAVAGSKPTPKLEKGTPTRRWSAIDLFGFDPLRNNDLERVPEDPDRPDDPPKVGEIGGLLARTYDFGFAQMLDPGSPLPPKPPSEIHATGRIFASAGGGIYGASAEAPVPTLALDPRGSQISLVQKQSYVKRDVKARFSVHVKQARVELFDAGSSNVTPCGKSACEIGQSGWFQFVVLAYNKQRGTVYAGETYAMMKGWHGHWQEHVNKLNRKFVLMWGEEKMPTDKDVGHNDGRHARISIDPAKDLFIPIDISAFEKDEEFTVLVEINIGTLNARFWNDDAPSYAGVFFRDPTRIDGDPELILEGLEATDRPEEPPAPDDTNLPPECRAKAAAGTLSIVAPTQLVPEAVGATGAELVVIRSQGTSGEVSATLTTSDGTATAPRDYQSVRTTVTFKNGDTAAKVVNVPLLYSPAAEPDKTFTVTLSEPTGCATLGQSTSVVTIVDGTLPIPPERVFTLSGTVSGLTGGGLVLRTNTFDQVQPTANGTFVFPVAIADGAAYSVSVATQPGNPVQSCTVTNGSGTIAGASVTNIAVDCVTPPPNGAVDAGFGSQGIVSGTPTTAIERQADGKILAIGGMVVARYNADGSVDTGFGSAGRVTLVANGGALDALKAISLQGDGKIVVAGNTSLPTARLGDDFVVFRLNVDGSLDPGFGGGGKVVTDFAGSTDRAVSVMVQADGKIVAAGQATQGTLVFAVARYLADGTPDVAFGSAGKATVNVTAGGDFANAASLQADGSIVVVGRTFHERFGRSSGEPDIGAARFRADGTVDTGFGTNGVVRIDTTIGSVTAPDFDGGNWDDANDVVILADGTIAIGGYSIALGVERPALALVTSDGQLGGVVSSAPGDRVRALALQADGRIVAASSNSSDFALTRFLATGALDTSFGNGGQLLIDVAGGTDLANDLLVQPDGKIVVVGSASNGTSRGSALVRVQP